MTIENSRFSVAGNDDTGGESPMRIDDLIVAQAEVEPVPVEDETSQSSGQQGGGALPRDVTADAQNIVRLPAGVSLDQFRVDGPNLVLVQADGSEIVVINGALNIPTFLVGDVEIPQTVVVAALDASGIDVAAGPDGLSAVSGSRSSGANFDTLPDANPDEDISTLALLDDTDLEQDAGDGEEELQDEGNNAPTVAGGDFSGTMVESADNVGGVFLRFRFRQQLDSGNHVARDGVGAVLEWRSLVARTDRRHPLRFPAGLLERHNGHPLRCRQRFGCLDICTG